MSTAKSLLKYAVGWDLTSEDSVAQPTRTTGETVMTEKGQPLPYPLDACAGCRDLTEQLATVQAEIEDWRKKFQKALTP
jgi:hypothetical protein